MPTGACTGPHSAHVFMKYHAHTERSKEEVEGEESVEKDQAERKAKSEQEQMGLKWVAVVRRVY